MKISNQKQKELEQLLFDEFGLTKIYTEQLEKINAICNKAEKDYVFLDLDEQECKSGCKDCQCKETPF